MLLIEVAHIGPEGMEVNAPLDPGVVHLAGEESFELKPGAGLACRLERGDDDTVHVLGRLSASLGLECGRCVAPFAFPVDQNLDLFYLPHRADQDDEAEEEVELADHEMVVAYYREGRLDLGEMVREQFFLSLPLKRLCRPDCRGLCPSCGANWNDRACECPPPAPDPRLASLGQFFES